MSRAFRTSDGYKLRANHQDRLRVEVVAHLLADVDLMSAAATAISTEFAEALLLRSLADILVPAPMREPRTAGIYERAVLPVHPRLGVNYLEREARNASLGSAGEAFVLEFEHRRLWEAGARHLADRIEHVAKTQGDGLGYDITSFDPDGSEYLIEVKTTGFGAMTPFFATKREVSLSDERAQQFRLYRLYKSGLLQRFSCCRDRCGRAACLIPCSSKLRLRNSVIELASARPTAPPHGQVVECLLICRTGVGSGEYTNARATNAPLLTSGDGLEHVQQLANTGDRDEADQNVDLIAGRGFSAELMQLRR